MIGEVIRYAGALVLALPFLVLPRRLRFRGVLWASRTLAPLAGWILVRRYENTPSGAPDETARILFRAIARMRVSPDPAFTPDISDDVLAVLQAGPAIVVTAHFPMNPVFTRWLADQGRMPVIIRDTDGAAPIVWGTAERFDVLEAGNNVLVEVRRCLREGRLVLAAIDRAAGRSRTFDTRFCAVTIGTPLFTLAEKLDVPLLFLAARLPDRGLPLVTVRRIAYDPEAFIDALQRHTALMLA